MTFGTLDDALDGKPVVLIPSSFTVADADYKQTRVLVDEETETESFKKGQSATCAPKVHSFDFKSGKLVLLTHL
jgi:hypothetical protein